MPTIFFYGPVLDKAKRKEMIRSLSAGQGEEASTMPDHLQRPGMERTGQGAGG